ncbi:MAG: hypothetical protein K5786_07690 [Treponema sp.]|nr:hypothetical protein [Treponema sp.]
MMKKRPALLLILLSIVFSSCTKKENKQFYVVDSGQYIQEVENVSIPREEKLRENAENKVPADKNAKVDFDLTKMSPTMIYSTVFDMMIAPENYENKVIKVEGMFNIFINEVTNDRYYAVLVQDATACCQQGLEFIWIGDHNFPDDYPEEFSEIVVTGTFTTAEEDGITYSYLNAWSVEKVL